MGVRSWVGNKLFNIDKVVDDKVSERLNRYNSIESNELLAYRMFENQIWAKGNADRILEFYKKNIKPAMYETNRLLFWHWVGGINVPKLHYPAPEALLNSMKSLLFGTEPTIEFVTEDDKLRTKVDELNERLWAIHDENNINEFRQNGAVTESYSGTIATKFIIDKDVSDKPIFQLYPQERIELVTKYNRVIEIIFKDYYKKDTKTYTLKSKYGLGYIKYVLLDDKNEEVALTTFSELAHLKPKVFSEKILMASYKKNRTNNIEFPDSGYGGSDFEGIIDLFHQIDEIYSTMALYIRRTRPTMTINEMLLPTDEKGRKTAVPKEYEFDVITLRQTDSVAKADDYFRREVPKLDLAIYTDAIKELMKSVYQKVGYSAVTANLGDVGANQSGKALMELEKATMILYQNKVQLWEKFEQDNNRLMLIYEDIMKFDKIITDYKEYDLKVEFPDYHVDSFEEKVKIFTNAYQGDAIDIEGLIDEIWGDSLEEERRTKMIRNIKVEKGIPLIGSEIEEGNDATNE